MTAEIAILNRHGVALAADSAVSVGQKKVFNSANKLFALTKHHPVGIMVYGSAHFMGIPWETIIKYYRRHHLAKKNFAHLVDFAEDFLNFLNTTDIISADSEQRYVLNTTHCVCQQVVKGIQDRVKLHFERNPSIDVAQTNTLIEEEVNENARASAALTSCQNFTPKIKSKIKKDYRDDIDQVINDEFEKLPLNSSLRKKVHKSVLDVLGSTKFVEGYSGIVIAGFGKVDIFPKVVEMRLDGRAKGFLKFRRGTGGEISASNVAGIVPFAQREMVDTFMAGINPDFHQNLKKGLELIVRKVPEILASKAALKIPAERENDISSAVDELLQHFNEEIENIQQIQYVKPVISSVAALPLDELAAMAESLVNLTSFKRKVSMVPESVGGPIDVAVISKGDGFIWIKRKHYFSAEINHHFFAYNDEEADQND